MSPTAHVQNAFNTLGISIDDDFSTASKAYKRLALIHHPDRNHNDPLATERFQQIGAAWDICQKHYENPAPQFASGVYFDDDDEDDWLDEEELHAFYMYMFAESLFGRYSRDRRRRYRDEHSGFSRSSYDHYDPSSYSGSSDHRVNEERQRKEREEYEKRKRQLEQEIEQEERQRERQAKDAKATASRRANALDHAFQSASTGNSDAVRQSVLEFDLDVNAPRKRVKQPKKQEDRPYHETLLHLAAKHCDETLVMFLVEKGANPQALDKEQLTPFHAAISAGNVSVVRFIVQRRGRSFDGYHPSKAAPSGDTPLQLAINSGVTAMVELLIKDATTHDVERCWKLDGVSEEIKQVLRTKKGFVPPEEKTTADSKPKEAQIAEELARAALNRQKKEERARKRAEREQEEAALRQAAEEARVKMENEERQRLAAARRIQEEKDAREKELREAKLKIESEAREREAREKARQVEAEELERARLRAEAKARAEEKARVQAKVRAQERARAEEQLRVQEKARAQERARAEEKARVQEQARVEERRAQEQARSREQAKVEERRAQEQTLPPVDVIQDAKPKTTRLSKEEYYAVKKAKLKEKRKLKAENRAQEQGDSWKPKKQVDMENMTPQQRKKWEDILRRRAEQSARDKAKNQQKHVEKDRTLDYAPPTPVSMRSSVSPELLMKEDIQTCIIPDDLFRDEPIRR